ncbi:MAG: RNA polymerase subunit sigma-70 [Gallionellales bacterium RIFCSPLOWO2_02_FULL_57_47]|nr:MAG: RNA polymerase subunit sigma-70 [Gallionellales bacterium RIFCSPLOWO2_02_FULL_57_47]OGT16499.1 MAG: RNA polymerase subunit sigma-70 [Gallionellales bacterium RIFCSPHIGHO2_02_FULL_57_16]
MLSFPCILRAWNAHESELRNYLRHRAGDAHLADDLLQEVFVKAMQQGKQFCALDNARAWLFQVARNALADHHRLGREVAELPEDIPQPESTHEPIQALGACVKHVLSELTAEDRDIIEQCDLEGVKQKDYAVTHGLTLAAVKSRLLRARERMRSQMSAACQVSFDEQGRVTDHVQR